MMTSKAQDNKNSKDAKEEQAADSVDHVEMEAAAPEVDDEGRQVDRAHSLEAESKIKNYALGAAGIAMVPAPLFDIGAITALQVGMIAKLCKHYDREFSAQAARAAIVSLSAGVLSVGVGITGASLLKSVPGIGWYVAGLGMPAAAGASTYAFGKVYQRHFEQGGSMFDLKTAQAKEYFREQVQRGKELVKRAKPVKKGPATVDGEAEVVVEGEAAAS